MPSISAFLTTGEAARHISDSPIIPGTVAEWQVRRIFELGDLDEPPKFGGKRLIAVEQISAIVAACRARGWLPQVEEATP